nr:hypothetical protein [Tanacetum cinerariifolium]
MPVPPAGQVLPPDVLNTHTAWVKASKEIADLMLMTMDPDIQKNLEHLGAYDMLKELKTLYAQQAEQELLQTVREFHAGGKRTVCKLLRSQNEEPYRQLGTSRSCHDSKPFWNQGKGKAKIGYAPVQAPPFAPKPKNPQTPKKDNPAKDAICHQCGEVGHWRRNCPVYLAELMKKNKLSQGASTSGIFTIELYSFPSTSWVYDTGCGTHICTTTQGLRGSRKLKPGALSLYVGDGHRAAIEAIGESHLLFQKEVENQLGKTIKSLRSDRRGEYMSQEFLDHLKEHGIIAHRTPLYTPQNNGVSERRNRTLLDMVRSMMSQTTLPKSLWDYALESAARILNMVPTKKNKVFVARNAEFLKNSLIAQEASGSLEDLEIIQEEDMHPSIDTSINHEEDDQEIDEPQSDINPIRRSTRTHRPTDRLCLYVDAEEHELGDLDEPANYKAALLDPESDKWLNAMNVEMQFMRDNEVWESVDLLPNGKTVGHKWLFKKKTDMDGAVHTYKARLVAKGFTRTPGIDYEETFSPVADIRAIRILIAIAAFYDYEIWQMDVKTAFLNGYLNEEVYMEQQGFVNQKFPNRVCKLKRSINGLKQPSRQWNKRFDVEIKKFGFNQNRDEPCVYVKASGNLGEAAYILGIKIYRDRSKRLTGLCQSAYIEKILKRFYMENSKHGTIPMQEKLKLSKSQGASTPAEIQRMQNITYASAVESIMYVVRCTRPDVAFAQNITSRFQHSELHWTTVKNILKYLRNTKDMFLVYGGDTKRELRVSCYTDAGYLTDADDRKWICVRFK